MKNTKEIILSILLSLVWIVVLYLIALLALLIIVPIITFIFELPVISTVLGFLLKWSDSYLPEIVYGASAILAIGAIKSLADKIIKNENIHNLSLKISGIAVIALNVIFFIVNIINGAPVTANIMFAISGFYLASSALD